MPHTQPRPTAALLLAALVLLAGCSDRSGYPSLAPRPAEQPAAAATRTAPAGDPGSTADAALDARAAVLVRQADQADAAFQSEADRVCPMIARGINATQGSEAWIAAQQALSALDAARGGTRAAAAELDQALIDNGTSGASKDISRIAEALAKVSALDAGEQARTDAIRAGNCGR